MKKVKTQKHKVKQQSETIPKKVPVSFPRITGYAEKAEDILYINNLLVHFRTYTFHNLKFTDTYMIFMGGKSQICTSKPIFTDYSSMYDYKPT